MWAALVHRLRYDRGIEGQGRVEPFLDFIPNWSLEPDLSERACLRGSLMSVFFGSGRGICVICRRRLFCERGAGTFAKLLYEL